MRLSIVKIVFRKELREMLRDRRSLTIMFGIPLVLYPILTVLIGTIGVSKKKQFTETPARVAIVNGGDAPSLIDVVENRDSGATLVLSSDPDKDLAAGKLDAVLIVPSKTQAQALAGQQPEIIIKLDRSRTSTAFVEGKISKLLSNYDRWVVEQRLRDRGESIDLLQPLKRSTVDIASADQRFGKLMAMSLPVILLMTGMLGALFPALNATTTERELGTLETLLVTPAGRMELLVAKGALVLLSGLLTSALNMLSMSLVLWRSLSLFEGPMGALTINLKTLGLAYLAAVPTLITFTTLVLIVGLLARTFREANHFATPIMMIPLASMLIGIAEPEMTPALLVTPVANTTLIIRDVMVGRITPGAFVLAFISSMVYAGLFLSMAARVFTNEQLVNPAWEPLTFKGLKTVSGAGRKKQFRLPSVDEALALFSVTLLLSFYVAPSLSKLGFTGMLLVQEIALLAAPAIAWAWMAKFKWVETFSWRKPGVAVMLAAVLLGAGLSPWMQLLQMGQEKIWPPNREYQESLLQLLLPSIERFPIFMPVLIGILAGTCEEILFRGPIQKGLLRRLPIWPAIVITAILFAAAHLDLYGLPIRSLLGVILGWLVVRTGSIFPAMATHAVFDITQLLHLSYAVHRVGAKNLESSEGGISVWMLAGGAAMIALAGFVLAGPRRKSSADLPVSLQSEC